MPSTWLRWMVSEASRALVSGWMSWVIIAGLPGSAVVLVIVVPGLHCHDEHGRQIWTPEHPRAAATLKPSSRRQKRMLRIVGQARAANWLGWRSFFHGRGTSVRRARRTDYLIRR